MDYIFFLSLFLLKYRFILHSSFSTTLWTGDQNEDSMGKEEEASQRKGLWAFRKETKVVGIQKSD